MLRGSVYECDVIPVTGKVPVSSLAVFRDKLYIGYADGSLRVGSIGQTAYMVASLAPARATHTHTHTHARTLSNHLVMGRSQWRKANLEIR
jgi:hypothetical protein